MKKFSDTLLLLLLGVFLPLVFKMSLVFTWPVWVVAITGIFLNLSQPQIRFRKGESDFHDKGSFEFILIAGLLSFIVPIIDYGYLKMPQINISNKYTIFGISFIFLGLGFRYWSIRVLGKFFTTKVQILDDHQLVKTGPYKFLRHPSYLGALIGLIGVSIFLQSILGFLVIIFLYFPSYVYRIHCEELALVKNFPNDYPLYQKESWRLIPYIY